MPWAHHLPRSEALDRSVDPFCLAYLAIRDRSCRRSCWRLAKFNLDTRQTSGFLGLPTPSNGLFWVIDGPGHRTGVAVHPGPAMT
jgi:hypothetical protein